MVKTGYKKKIIKIVKKCLICGKPLKKGYMDVRVGQVHLSCHYKEVERIQKLNYENL